MLNPGGFLVLTYPTSWDEVEDTDLWRFTKKGMEHILSAVGFEVIVHTRRASVPLGGFNFPLGYGLVARKPMYSSVHTLCGDGGILGVVPDQEESAGILADVIISGSPCLYLRYGDGMIECIYGRDGQDGLVNAGATCDGELYSEPLGKALLSAWQMAIHSPLLYLGDWESASFSCSNESNRYLNHYRNMIGDANPRRLHYEALLFMDNRPGVVSLQRFWRAVVEDKRRKVLMAPQAMHTVADRLGCEHFVTPMGGLHAQLDTITEKLYSMSFDVLLWGAGMASNIPVIQHWHDHRQLTYINIGSSLDPVCRGRTRTQQMLPTAATKVFNDSLTVL